MMFMDPIPVQMMMMMMIDIHDDLGRSSKIFNDEQSSFLCRSPKDKEKKSQKQETIRKKCTQISTKSQLKSMVLSRFRMEK